MQRIGTKRIECIRYGTPTKRIIARSLLFSPALRAAAQPLPAGRWPIWNTTDGDACNASAVSARRPPSVADDRHKTTVNAAEAVAFINAGGYIGVADALVARKRGTGFTGVMAHVIRQEKQLF